MKKSFLIIVLISFYCSLFSQIKFEKGYFIDTLNQKTECLIKNVDWKNNPTKFEYKISETSPIQTETINTISEFGVYNFSKYVKVKVKIDRSSNELSSLSNVSQPIFSEETLLLKVITEGEATLYQYENSNLVRFFYKLKNGTIQQLIYKKYLTENSKLIENAQFRQELFNFLKCNKTANYPIQNLLYNRNDLIKYFELYNSCFGTSTPQNTLNTNNKKNSNFKIQTLINVSSLDLYFSRFLGTSLKKENEFKAKMNVSIGFEYEKIMSFNKNKWSVFLSPNFNYFNGTSEYQGDVATVKFKALQIPIGLRYYMFLNKHKFFLNTAFCMDLPFKNQITFENSPSGTLNAGFNFTFFVGGGYSLNKFNAEIRYYLPRPITDKEIGHYSDFKQMALVLGYKF